jgi:tripartite-type tricarboxylate transporter receptor subunit TctC
VATVQEQGMRDFEASNWMALFLPSATPEPILARLASQKALPLRGVEVGQERNA